MSVKSIAIVVAVLCAVAAFGTHRIFFAQERSSSASMKQGSKMNTGILEVAIGQSGAEITRQSQVPISRGQVAGLAFYESSDIENRSAPQVKFNHDHHGFLLPIARSVLLTADEGRGRQVEDIEIGFKLPELPQDPTNAQAVEQYDRAVYALVSDVIQRINAAGWTRFIGLSQPRIQGIATYLLDQENPSGYQPTSGTIIHLDPSVLPSFEQWSQVTRRSFSHGWRWYQAGILISLLYSKAPRELGVPMVEGLTLQIRSERQVYLSYDPGSKGDWEAAKLALGQAIPHLIQRRVAEEAKARAAGLKILEDWQDPAIAGIVVPKH